MLEESKPVLVQLKLIFDTIIKFCRVQEIMYTTALREIHALKLRQQKIEKRSEEVKL